MQPLILLPLAVAAAAVALPTERDAQFGPPGHGQPPFGFGHPPFGPSRPPFGPGQHDSNAAAYFLNNDPSGNSIVSLHVDRNGMLSQPAKTSTGGNGGISVNSTGGQFQSDSLGSQGAVTVADNMLFTVNSGSNTVSMFAIDPRQPWNLRLVGTPMDTLGEFPVSVTYSSQLRQACVLNGGMTAGVTCFSVDPFHGLSNGDSLRQLNYPIIHETTPPNGPPGSAAQVLFNPDSSALFATVKADATNKTGSMVVWPTSNGKVSTGSPVINQIEGIALDFGFSFLSNNHVLLSSPSFGGALLSIGTDHKATETAHLVVAGQQAACWSQWDPSLNTAYIIDAGTTSISKVNPQAGTLAGSIEASYPGDSTAAGVFDASIMNQKMYALTAANGIVVVDLVEEKTAQFLDLSNFGKRQYYQGMAVYSAAGRDGHAPF